MIRALRNGDKFQITICLILHFVAPVSWVKQMKNNISILSELLQSAVVQKVPKQMGKWSNCTVFNL
ncbi:hypothetical protein XENTR_v10021013 [Xenopus tropicalis]|nr:hypothetical protein XENTR_v10021013 [Xenopus tropicalis]